MTPAQNEQGCDMDQMKFQPVTMNGNIILSYLRINVHNCDILCLILDKAIVYNCTKYVQDTPQHYETKQNSAHHLAYCINNSFFYAVIQVVWQNFIIYIGLQILLIQANNVVECQIIIYFCIEQVLFCQTSKQLKTISFKQEL